SWLCNWVNCVFQGDSTLCRFVTIFCTVASTSKPVPLVGDPKLSPTVPIVHSGDGLADCTPTVCRTDWGALTCPIPDLSTTPRILIIPQCALLPQHLTQLRLFQSATIRRGPPCAPRQPVAPRQPKPCTKVTRSPACARLES